MNLEDLFKQKPREELVTAPAEEPQTLDKFFAERQITPKQTAPLDEAKKEEIKSVFNTAAPQQAAPVAAPPMPTTSNEGYKQSESSKDMMGYSQSGQVKNNPFTGYEMAIPQYAPATATSDLVDMEKIRSQVDGMMPEKGIEDWLTVLAPLATEAIFGGGKAGGVSYGIAGKQALDIVKEDRTRRTGLEDKLMEIQKARQIASAKASGKNSGKSAELMGPNGEAILAPQEFAFGKQLWKKDDKDTFMQKVMLQKMKGDLQEKIAAGKATALEKKALRDLEVKMSEKWDADPFTRDTRTVTDAYNKLSKVNPDKFDPIRDISVVFDFMKTLDPNSVVRESEQGLVMGARSIQDLMDNLVEVKTGKRKLTSEQIRNIQQFAANNYTRRQESQKSQIDAKFIKRAEKYGLDPAMIVGDLSIGTPMLWTKPDGTTSIISVQPQDMERALQLQRQK